MKRHDWEFPEKKNKDTRKQEDFSYANEQISGYFTY